MISITDKPIQNAGEDLLKVDRHSKALSDFILRSETPLTIGLQGEWGSGKTSLMYLLREKLETSQVATAWVNTWEYSMFRGAHETTPAVLQGLLLKLKESCGDQWTLNDQAKEKWRSVVRFAGALGNQILANQTGVDPKAALNDSGNTSLANKISDIADLKAAISDIIEKLISDPKNDYRRIVFFIDDLDRISPSDAVEVLEALKNVFDIPHCIFVLAIDYEVVVKGLEGKFGPKTEENEREFRSFFDKIIQLPFSMPTGTYDIENFLGAKLTDLGVVLTNEQKDSFAKVVKHTVGYNPRSLKRYINSFSLLNSIRKLDEEAEDDGPETDELMLFALLGIQISYPKIFRTLMASPNFLAWDPAFGARNGLEWEKVLEGISKFGESELTDEDWERVVWGSCQRDTYLKSRVTSVLELLNLLRSQFGDRLHDQIEQAMAFAAITSVDDDASAKQAIEKSGKRIRFEGIDVKLEQLKERGVKGESIEVWTLFWARIDDYAGRAQTLQINYAKTSCTFNDLSKSRERRQQIFCVDPGKTSLGMRFWIKNSTDRTAQIKHRVMNEFPEVNDALMVETGGGDLLFETGLGGVLGGSRYSKLLHCVLDELGYK